MNGVPLNVPTIECSTDCSLPDILWECYVCGFLIPVVIGFPKPAAARPRLNRVDERRGREIPDKRERLDGNGGYARPEHGVGFCPGSGRILCYCRRAHAIIMGGSVTGRSLLLFYIPHRVTRIISSRYLSSQPL